MNKLLMKQLEQWFKTQIGQTTLQYELEKVVPLMEQSFGYLALQVGLPDIDYLAHHHARKKLLLSTSNDTSHSYKYPHINAAATQIPLESQSVDLVILPHVHETHLHFEQILNDVYRVLINEGCVVVLGFNPIHVHSLRHIYHSPFATPIPYQHQFSPHRIKEWFKLSGFEVKPPPAKSRFFTCFSQKDLVYMLVARKRNIGMHLVGPAIVKKKKPTTKAAVVTQQMNKQ